MTELYTQIRDSTGIENAVDLISESYSPLTSECKRDLIQSSKLVHLDKSMMIVKEGQFADKMYFVVCGCVRAFYDKDGKEVTDWFAFEGDFMSAINSFYQGVPSKHNMEAIEATSFLEIKREVIFELTEKHHCFERLGRIAVTKTMLQLQDRIVALQFETAQQRLENLLLVRPDIIQRVPLTYIASHLGITLETLSRIRNPKNRI